MTTNTPNGAAPEASVTIRAGEGAQVTIQNRGTKPVTITPGAGETLNVAETTAQWTEEKRQREMMKERAAEDLAEKIARILNDETTTLRLRGWTEQDSQKIINEALEMCERHE
jgi:hypothetical protein